MSDSLNIVFSSLPHYNYECFTEQCLTKDAKESSKDFFFNRAGNNIAYLGFSHRQEDNIAKEALEKMRNILREVVRIIRNKFNLSDQGIEQCTCMEPYKMGILVKRIELPGVRSLSEMSIEHIDEDQQAIQGTKEVYERVKESSLKTWYNKGFSSPTPDMPVQTTFNELAIETFCGVAMKYGIEKQRIVEQVQLARRDGYLSQKSFCALQLTVLK